jgi:hypothetical protein
VQRAGGGQREGMNGERAFGQRPRAEPGNGEGLAGRRRGAQRLAGRLGLGRSRIARFRSLPPSDRTLFLIALPAIASVRVGLWLTSFPACASFPRADLASDRIT